MDGSFLSDADVVAASRDFVCIRTLTYEDAEEAKFLSTIYTGRSGQLENTTFGILSPDGRQKLTRTGRAPFHEYRDSKDMAEGMKEIAGRYAGATDQRFTDPALPITPRLDLALNVAAADQLPLVVLIPENEEQKNEIIEALRRVVWTEALAGQFVFNIVDDREELKPLTGLNDGATGAFVVQPDEFGMTGAIMIQIDWNKPTSQVDRQLREVVAKYPRPYKDHNRHVQQGIELGVDWKSQIPETDPESVRARKRMRGDR